MSEKIGLKEYMAMALALIVIGTGVYSCLPKMKEYSSKPSPASTVPTPRMPKFHIKYEPSPDMKKIVDVAKKNTPSKAFEDGVDLKTYSIIDLEIPGKEFSDKIDYNLLVSVIYYEDCNGNPFKIRVSGCEKTSKKSNDPRFRDSMIINFSPERYCFWMVERGIVDGINGFLDRNDGREIDPKIGKSCSKILEIIAEHVK